MRQNYTPATFCKDPLAKSFRRAQGGGVENIGAEPMAGIVLKSSSAYLMKAAEHYDREAQRLARVPSLAKIYRDVAESYRAEAEGQRLREEGWSL